MTNAFRSVQRVYFDDLDALNILHNVRYLLFIERARGEMFNAMGFRWDDHDNADRWHVVAAHDIRYLKPFRGEGELVVELCLDKLGVTSMILSARVSSRDGEIVFAEGATRLVRIDEQTSKPCAWSERMRNAVAMRAT